MTRLPLVHLDQIYWRPNWAEPQKAEWQQQLSVELAKPEWILDGNYNGSIPLRLQLADTAILLDLPTWLCLLRTLKRSALGWGRRRPDMAIGCPERFDLTFIRYIWNFGREKRPKLLANLEEFSGRKIVLQSPGQVRRLLQSLQKEEMPG